MLCARECPDWCIYIDSHKETIPAPEGGRARQRNVLDRFAIDFSLCMYCGICIEVCPFDALFWSPEFEYAEGDIRNLLHEKDKLAAWTQTVPPPPAHDPGAEPPKELTAAPRRPAASRATPSARQPTAPKPATAPDPDGAADPARGTSEPAGERSTSGTPEPTADAPTTGPAAPSRPPAGGRERPRRSMADVRAIRPPGALPPGAQGDAPAEGPDPADTGGPAAPPTGPESSEPESAEDTGRSEGQEARPQGPASSTDRPSLDTLSTASSHPQPEPGPPEQTSPASPRKRRMADPRSIRPPGRLGPDDTRESEEES
ncbi:4Fe-4S binding protein [Nonomuraea sp. KM88]|uniref:4Fe-4S binding protein n=1 Tax=Nonomuraea sp. KM88 TaxID=3457427 RepID=UPI003FCDE22A